MLRVGLETRANLDRWLCVGYTLQITYKENKMEQLQQIGNWISVREAAKISGYVTEWIRELARDGAIKSRKIGNMVLVDLKSLEEYVEVKKNAG